MKKDILDRYDRTIENKIIIKVSTHKFENLFDNFDMSSSFLKKDLSSNLLMTLNGYSSMVLYALKSKFPNTKIEFIFCSVSSTGSSQSS